MHLKNLDQICLKIIFICGYLCLPQPPPPLLLVRFQKNLCDRDLFIITLDKLCKPVGSQVQWTHTIYFVWTSTLSFSSLLCIFIVVFFLNKFLNTSKLLDIRCCCFFFFAFVVTLATPHCVRRYTIYRLLLNLSFSIQLIVAHRIEFLGTFKNFRYI